MQSFEQLRPYVFQPEEEQARHSKHSFYPVTKEDIDEAEQRLGFKFPSELRQFYIHIGYGFLWNTDQTMFDRLMDPGSVADFRFCEGLYESQRPWDYYEDQYFVFFEVSEVSYIAMDLRQMNFAGQCPIFYMDTKIAASLEEFIRKMDAEMDYYLRIEAVS